MLDLNDVTPPKPARFDLDAITEGLRMSAHDWVARGFPSGRAEGDEWRLANIAGDPPRKSGSCVISLKGAHAGSWHDFATGEGGGPLSTLEYATGLSGRDLFAHAADLTGHAPRTPPTPKRNTDGDIAFILSGCVPIPGTPAETYLRSRGLPVPASEDLLFHPDLTHYPTKRGYPGMVARIRDGRGEVVALHRTWLAADGSGKAEIKKARMMLGKAGGGAVRLVSEAKTGALALCEGIETGLAVLTACPELAVWACLSTRGMELAVLPDDVREVILLADHDASGAGMDAALKTSARLIGEGKRVWIAKPPDPGSDFNDLLQAEGPDAVRQAVHSAEEQDWRAQDDDEPEPAATESEHEIAKAFARRHKDCLRYDHHRGRWYLWDGARWQLEETRLAFDWARQECCITAQELRLNRDETNRLLRASTAASVERFAMTDRAHAVVSEIWDADPFLLGTPGGTVDLRSGELRPARRETHITRLTAVAPDLQADCSLWRRFLEDATRGDVALIRYLQQISGYCLSGDTREHALFFIYGEGGNGKSVFLSTLNGILKEYTETAGLDTFMASSFDKHSTDIAMLKGARLVSVSETEEGRAWAETRIKQMTGGDKITARFMRQDNFTFRPTFKLVIVGNHKPVLRNVDEATRRRFNIIPFTNKFPNPDRQLEEKLRAEWPAILAWMIDGCLDWQRHGLVRPDSVRQATAAYFDDQDLFGQWIEECCTTGAHEWEVTSKIFQSWKSFAERQSESPGSAKSFSANLVKRGYVNARDRIGGTVHRYFKGIALKFNPEASGIIHD